MSAVTNAAATSRALPHRGERQPKPAPIAAPPSDGPSDGPTLKAAVAQAPPSAGAPTASYSTRAIRVEATANDNAPWRAVDAGDPNRSLRWPVGRVINATVFCLKRRMLASVSIELGGDRLELRGPWSQDKQAVIDKWIEAHSNGVEEDEEAD
ncbi:hypothetical protein QFZ82_005184 [Streptomyces sp. V4I23]|uniref:hypothetical protein n=1 Tax=Streptomyces sp. V4I23 TaxID=3042282 RepID=UPI00278AD6C1|nr:hypothetical protein [Streptomyces sp. V4I23]MDQ1010699.1 hypothetical protein [Streptomyces sp. V4I23]